MEDDYVGYDADAIGSRLQSYIRKCKIVQLSERPKWPINRFIPLESKALIRSTYDYYHYHPSYNCN